MARGRLVARLALGVGLRSILDIQAGTVSNTFPR